jgi:hypothetical protein
MNCIEREYHRKNWLEDYIRFMRLRKQARKQNTFCWCPLCGEDLCSNRSFKSDTETIKYECSNCGCRSSWNFDAPLPILIKFDKLKYTENI